jgi:hypothetical protein
MVRRREQGDLVEPNGTWTAGGNDETTIFGRSHRPGRQCCAVLCPIRCNRGHLGLSVDDAVNALDTNSKWSSDSGTFGVEGGSISGVRCNRDAPIAIVSCPYSLPLRDIYSQAG